jgi:Rps23 Pro-64 3,4-dihydroxylase Tpa1-like proline 4-hydroxylase
MEKNKSHKINLEKLEKINNISNQNIEKYFGDWIKNPDKLKDKFQYDKPFGHIVIDDFLSKEFANTVHDNYPQIDEKTWWIYNNPIEVKYANDHIERMNENVQKIFYLLSSDHITNIFSKISNIPNLEYDPHLHGAGLHAHPRYGRLNIHLDYEKHPKLENRERRLNIILFLNKNWKKEWHGDNQLWDKDIKKCCVQTYPVFNRALIFQTNNISWHGVPEKIMCPEGIFRKTLAYYYISPLTMKNPLESPIEKPKFGNDGSGYRTKAAFIKRPHDPYLLQLEQLYKIRPFRRIEQKDMEKIWPEWNKKEF